MKAVWWVLLLAGLGAAGVYGYNWYREAKKDPYATFVKPRVEMSNFQITSLSRERTVANLKVLVDNPAPVGFSADSLQYQIFIAGKEVMSSSYPKPVRLAANDSTLVSMPITIDNIKMLNTLKSLENQDVDSVDYTMKAQVFTDLPFLNDKPINLSFTKKLPVYRIPKVKLQKVDVKKLGLNETKLVVKMEITNPNVFAYRFRETTYRVTLDGDEFAEGHIDEAIHIPAHGKTELDLPMEVKLKEAGAATWDMLTKPEEVDYAFVFRTKIVDQKGNNTFQDSKVVMENSGKLKDLLDEAKEVAKEAKEKKKEEKKAEKEEKKDDKKG